MHLGPVCTWSSKFAKVEQVITLLGSSIKGTEESGDQVWDSSPTLNHSPVKTNRGSYKNEQAVLHFKAKKVSWPLVQVEELQIMCQFIK